VAILGCEMGEARGGVRGRLAFIGLDGATFRVLDPVIAAGAMPSLARLTERGSVAVLRSTVPTYTPPAWVSMVTGVNPGKHGIIGFFATTPQEKPMIAHSGLIKALPLWTYLNELGIRVGVFNVPMSYPPSPVDGFMVAGGLAAGWTDPEMPNFGSDESIARLVSKIASNRYPLDTVVSYENDWNSPVQASRIEAIQRLRRDVLNGLLERVDTDVVFAVFEGPDRLQHLHYQYIVDCSDWFNQPEASEMRERAFSYFHELDQGIDDLVDWVGADGHVFVVSDHGFGPWEKTVNLNLLLQEWGYLQLPSIGRLTRLPAVAGPIQRLARRLVPRGMLQAAKVRVNRGIAWEKTRAFASHVAEQGIHVSARGDLPHGILDPEEAARVADELVERLARCVDPADNNPIVDEVIKREHAVTGPFAARAPHLFPFCRDQRYELSDTLAAASFITDHRDRPWGYHHKDGVFIAAGPEIRPGSFSGGLDIVDVLPTALHLAGLPVPQGLDGRVVGEVLRDEAASRKVATNRTISLEETEPAYPFSPQEERVIEESLRGLGYLE
jgi:predicted AlkP superfamily phosphohydrolase/phosphomutase